MGSVPTRAPTDAVRLHIDGDCSSLQLLLCSSPSTSTRLPFLLLARSFHHHPLDLIDLAARNRPCHTLSLLPTPHILTPLPCQYRLCPYPIDVAPLCCVALFAFDSSLLPFSISAPCILGLPLAYPVCSHLYLRAVSSHTTSSTCFVKASQRVLVQERAPLCHDCPAFRHRPTSLGPCGAFTQNWCVKMARPSS